MQLTGTINWCRENLRPAHVAIESSSFNSSIPMEYTMALDQVDHESSFKDDRELKGLALDFAQFCTLELERRRNSEPEFDEMLYEEAVKLVLTKLEALMPGDLS
jgi:hypothetical protein